MAWTDITRPIYERNNVRYASDCLDEEWAIIEPLLPEPNVVGRPRTTEMRDVWDGVQYMASTGCQWRMIPKDFPPRSTIQGYFYDCGTMACCTGSTRHLSSGRGNWLVVRPVQVPVLLTAKVLKRQKAVEFPATMREKR